MCIRACKALFFVGVHLDFIPFKKTLLTLLRPSQKPFHVPLISALLSQPGKRSVVWIAILQIRKLRAEKLSNVPCQDDKAEPETQLLLNDFKMYTLATGHRENVIQWTSHPL